MTIRRQPNFNCGCILALKLLLVDPDQEWLSKAKKYFEENFYEVKSVSNGKEAQLSLFNDKYFGVVLNIDVQNHSGKQVLKFIRSNHPSLKVVLTMNVDHIESGDLDEEFLEKMGATEVLRPPFEVEQVKVMLEGHQSLGQMMASIPKREGMSDEVEVAQEDDKFSKINIHEFFPSKTILFDVFIRLSSGKYLKILHAGDSFSKERLDKYKIEKKVENLYFLSTDRKKYIRFQNQLTQKMNKVEGISAKTKVTLLKSTTEKFIEDAYVEGLKPQIVDQAKEICDTTYELISNTPDLFKVLKEYQNFDPEAYSHSFLAALFSSMIVKQFDWESKVTTETVAMACMFHDIGKMQLPEEIVKLKPWQLDEAQFEKYKEHPQLSYELLAGNRFITPSVKQVILQHHEASDGSGFPHGLRDSKILTLSKIVFTANEFVDFITEKKVPPPEGLKLMLSNPDMLKKFNGIILENFLKIFIDPSKINKDDNSYHRANALTNKKSNNKKAS